MATLTHDAQSHLARYLQQMRAALRGHPSVDPEDIERDVLGHIDAELVGRPEPIDEGELQRVLDRLGAPSQWVPNEDQSPWWEIVSRLRDGPEDWRLAYLTFALALLGIALFMGGPFLWPLPALLPVVAFFLARATIELHEHRGEPIGARRWLIYPVLLPWYVVFMVPLMLWPLAPTVGAINSTPAISEWVMAASSEPLWATVSSIGALAVGLWWMCLGLIVHRYPAAVRATFRPLGDWFERRHATRIALGGLLLAGAAGSILATVLT
jgi:hypothetical protein